MKWNVKSQGKSFCNQCSRIHKPRECFVGNDVDIHPSVEINVTEKLVIGSRTKILQNAKIEGRSVVLGKECFIHEYTWIGGGGCFEKNSEFVSGDWMHLGRFGHLNTAASINIGHGVGIGHQSSVFTHGGYLPFDKCYPFDIAPVTIEDNVWLPHAWVNPGVHIGEGAVIAAGSLINQHIPANSLCGGVPAKLLKMNYAGEKCYRSNQEMFDYFNVYFPTMGVDIKHYNKKSRCFRFDNTLIDIDQRTIQGEATMLTERVRDLLRRIGIRFRFKVEANKDGKKEYVKWKAN